MFDGNLDSKNRLKGKQAVMKNFSKLIAKSNYKLTQHITIYETDFKSLK